ncbi:MAG: sensor histidine kinase [Deltaproteobacteria bacterium]|nr:sensor histidine kinase [Deltaproteobacteria bacterium]
MEDLSLHILDVMENSIRAEADRIEVRIDEDLDQGMLTLGIRDNGKGMDAQKLAQATDPFFTTRTTRRFGLGLSLLSQAAEATGGSLAVESAPGKGTRVTAIFHRDHIDMKPLGDIPQTLLTLIAGRPDVDFLYSHRIDGEEFLFDTRDFRGVPLGSAPVLMQLAELMRDGLAQLRSRAQDIHGP